MPLWQFRKEEDAWSMYEGFVVCVQSHKKESPQPFPGGSFLHKLISIKLTIAKHLGGNLPSVSKAGTINSVLGQSLPSQASTLDHVAAPRH
jgi:hypothetical protein